MNHRYASCTEAAERGDLHPGCSDTVTRRANDGATPACPWRETTTMTLPQSAARAVATSTRTSLPSVACVESNGYQTRGGTNNLFASRIRPREMSSPNEVAINHSNTQWREWRDGRSYRQEENTERRTAIVSFIPETQQDRGEVNAQLRCGIRFVPEARKLQIQRSELQEVARTAPSRLRKTRYLHPLPRGHGP